MIYGYRDRVRSIAVSHPSDIRHINFEEYLQGIFYQYLVYVLATKTNVRASTFREYCLIYLYISRIFEFDCRVYY